MSLNPCTIWLKNRHSDLQDSVIIWTSPNDGSKHQAKKNSLEQHLAQWANWRCHKPSTLTPTFAAYWQWDALHRSVQAQISVWNDRQKQLHTHKRFLLPEKSTNIFLPNPECCLESLQPKQYVSRLNKAQLWQLQNDDSCLFVDIQYNIYHQHSYNVCAKSTKTVHLCWVASNTVWSHMAGDAP